MNDLGLALLASLLWVLAAPPFDLWPLGWIAMLPAIATWARAPSARRAGLYGWVTGAGMTIGGFHWFAGLMHEHAGLPWPVAALTLIALAAWQGLPVLITARVVWWIRRWRPLPMALVAPVVYVALEHVWPVIFPYQVAITQVAALPVVQVSDLLGANAVSALLVAVAGAAWDLIERRRAGWRPAAVVAGCVVVTLVYGVVRIADVEDARRAAPAVAVGLVQPNEQVRLGHDDPDAEARRLAAMQAETARLQAAGARVVVWSESSLPFVVPHRARHLRIGAGGAVVVGALSAGGGKRYNSAFLVEDGAVIARHDKIHRVLGSEWNPVTELIPSLEGTLPPGFHGGDAPVILPLGDLRLGPMICLEDVVPRYARALAAERPNLLVNLTIDTWFGTFAEPYQHRALAQLRAIELRADMVRAVNTGPSGLIEATGRLGPQTPVRPGDAPVEGLLVEAAVIEAGSVYASLGDLFTWLCLLGTIAGWWLARRSDRRASLDRRAAGDPVEPDRGARRRDRRRAPR